MPRIVANVLAGPGSHPAPAAALEFHRRLPGYRPTPLVEAPELGVWIKDESSRLGLPSFKVLGASWAAYRALSERFGSEPKRLGDFAGLRPLTLAAATDGNHGRAVARIASWCGLPSRIFVPASMSTARMDAIRSEGADVVVVDGSYDDAVAELAAQDRDTLVISDTAWPGYEQIPAWVVEGYSTIFAEIDLEPDVVVVQIGVGSLAASVVRAYPNARIIGVEPDGSACMTASIEAGHPVSIQADHGSIISGLIAGTPSPLAWPDVSRGIDTFVSISDDQSRAAMRLLARAGVTAGETGAAGLAGLLHLREHQAVSGTVLLINTEGATDPESYRRIVT